MRHSVYLFLLFNETEPLVITAAVSLLIWVNRPTVPPSINLIFKCMLGGKCRTHLS